MNGFMNGLKQYIKVLLIILIIGGLGYAVVKNYGFIFSRTVTGTIVKVERVELNVALMQTNSPTDKISPELYSFAVAVKDKETGEIVTASAQDRQWAVAQPGQCAEARFYPYAPWQLDKSGTYYGARLVMLRDCSPEAP